MKPESGMTVTVKLDNEEYQFLLVHTGGDGKERLSLEAPLARLLGGMGIGDWLWWRVDVPGGQLMRVELIGVDLPAPAWEADRQAGETAE